MADPWLLHTELHVAAVYDCCERTAAKELLRRKCCEGTAANRLLRTERIRSCIWLQYTTAAKELLRPDCCERTAAKELLRTDCCEGDCCMRLCFTPAENGLLHTELMRSWSGAAHD